MTPILKQHANKLRLPGLLSCLDLRLQEAESNRLPYVQFLELVLQDEVDTRSHRQMDRRQKAADFREARSLDEFDYQFNPSLDRQLIYQLATCHSSENILMFS